MTDLLTPLPPGGMPSLIPNNPYLQALLENGAPIYDVSQVAEKAAISAPDGSTFLTPQGPINELAALRRQFPFLPILSFPMEAVSAVMTANVAQDLRIPSGASLMLIRGSADYYIDRGGRAAVPTAATTPGDMSDTFNVTKSIYSPQGYLFYCGGITSISVVAPTTGTIVTAMFWAANEMPR